MRTRLRCRAVSSLVLGVLALQARAHGAVTVENGYEVTRGQEITPAPHGWIGRKTTDREVRTGVVPDETWGNSTEFSMTIGGWAKKCPSSEGLVEGVFEYVVTKHDVISDAGGTRRMNYSHQLTARLKGKVTDDARLEYVEIEGQFARRQDGAPAEFRNLPPTRFTPGPSGEPDWAAMRRTVEVTAELSWATAILMMGTNYQAAEIEWNKLATRCVEFAFDPPTDTRSAGPEEVIEVRPRIRTTGESGATVSRWGPFGASSKGGGTIEPPRESNAASIDPPVIKYKASAQPKRGHGFDIAAKSRAGVGEGRWRIVDPGFEGTFTYIDSLSWGVVDDLVKISGRLVWSPDTRGAASTFGEHESSFFRPTAGEMTVALESKSRGLQGMSDCKTEGSRTFPVSSLAQGALQYMLLEIADDGRYKLTLVIPDTPDPFPAWSVDSVCTFPNASHTSSEPVKHLGLLLGLQQGTLDSGQAVVGRTEAPIRRGPREVTGSWSFKRLGQP